MVVSRFVVYAIGFTCIMVGGAAFSQGFSSGVAETDCPGPMTTYPFPIVLRGASEMYGVRTDRVSALRYQAGKWSPVAVQVDEINQAGDYVLENGLPFTAGTGDGLYNGQDELSFEGPSLGEDFEVAAIPREILAEGGRFWKIRMCSGRRYYGSLLIWQQDVSLAPGAVFTGVSKAMDDVLLEPAVHFDDSLSQIKSDIYRYEFNERNPVLLGQVWLQGSDKTEYQIIERSSFVMPLRLPWWVPDFTLADANFKSTIECWRSGPVRTIVAVGVKFRNFLSLFNLHMFSELVFYRNKFQVPTAIQFSYDPSAYLKPGSGLFYSLTFPNGRSWDIETNLPDMPAKSASEIRLSGQTAAGNEVFYARGSRPEGAFVVNVRVDPVARKQVPPPYIVRQWMFKDDTYKALWTDLVAPGGDLGVYLDISGVRTGTYDFGLDLLLSREADQIVHDYGSVEARWMQLKIAAGPPAK